VIVLIVLLFLTKPLQYMPEAVLSSIVFLIGVELVDIKGMRRVLAWRRPEFLIACATAATVVIVGVEQGVILAIVLSILDHLRHGYKPNNTYLVHDAAGHIQSEPVADDKPPQEFEPGLVVYRFGAIMYYANAERLIDDVRAIQGVGATPPTWLCVDAEMISDVDFSAGATILDAIGLIQAAGTRLVFTRVKSGVREQLQRYGVVDLVGDDAFFDSIEALVEAYRARAST
jgi:SulP family sulfate permease